MIDERRLGKSIFLILCIVFTCFILSENNLAQEKLATFEGNVSDVDGAFLPGVSISLKNTETGYFYSSVTRSDGRFIIAGIEPGNYECEVSLSGFVAQINRGMIFTVGSKMTLDFQLSVASLNEKVTVTAENPLIEVTKTNVSGVVGRKEIDDLPILERNFTQLAILKAGVSEPGSGWRDSGGRGSGQPHGSSDVVVDGVSNEFAWWNANRSNLPADAIQEFRVLVNQFSAEYGNASGLVMHALTRSGTNIFKGRLYSFFRDEALDSKNYFAEEKQDFSQWRFGGFLGGPVVKDKFHFFLSYEGQRYKTYNVITSPLVPQESVPEKALNDQFLLKLNYQLNEKNMLSFRFTRDWPRMRDTGVGGIATKEWLKQVTGFDNVLQGNWTLYPSDKTMNELRIQYSHRNEKTRGGDIENYIVMRPSGLFGKNYVDYMDHPETRFQILDNFSLFLNNHSIKMGFDVNIINSDMYHNWGYPGIVYFGTDAPFDPGDAATYPYMMLYNDVYPVQEGMKHKNLGFYIQDTWNVFPDLTVNIGLRYSHYLWGKHIYSRSFEMSNKNNWDPRISFSWDPVGDKKTVIRGGVGKYTNNPMGNLPGLGVVMGEAYDVRLIFNPGWPDPFTPNPFAPLIGFGDQEEWNFLPGLTCPYSLQYTLGAQREFMRDLSVSADVVWAQGKDLTWFVNLNPIIPGTGYIHEDPTRVNRWFLDSGGRSDYKALYLTVEKRFSHGWGFEISYTLSKSLTDVETEANQPSNNEDRSLDYGPANNDARHRLAATGIFDLPFGFQLSTIMYWHSALPYTVVLGYDANLDGLNSDYPQGEKRNSRRGSDFFSLDARISKFLHLNQRYNIQVFAEMFNVTNRVNYGGPVGNMRSSVFGEPLEAFDPRLIQFGVRVNF